MHSQLDVLNEIAQRPIEDLATLPIAEMDRLFRQLAVVKYNAWPPAIRDLFAPARTLKTGKPTFQLERVKASTQHGCEVA